MGESKVITATISCDGPNCQKGVTFTQEQAPAALKANPWLGSVTRLAVNGKQLIFCCLNCTQEYLAGLNNLKTMLGKSTTPTPVAPPAPPAAVEVLDAHEGTTKSS